MVLYRLDLFQGIWLLLAYNIYIWLRALEDLFQGIWLLLAYNIYIRLRALEGGGVPCILIGHACLALDLAIWSALNAT